MRDRRTRKLFSIAAVAMLLGSTLVTGVQAASPHQADPSAMTPALNPDYDLWVCTVTGGGPICRESLTESWANSDTELSCGNRPIYSTGTFSADAVRWHLPDGRATHTFFQNQDSETWSLSPSGGGATLEVKGRWSLHYVYPDPGDRSTRVLTLTGIDWQVTAVGHGVVWHDIGVVQFVPGDDAIDTTHGPTDSNHGDLDLVVPAACAILAG